MLKFFDKFISHSNNWNFFVKFGYKVAVLFWANQLKYFWLLKNTNIRCKWKLSGVTNQAGIYMSKVNKRNIRTQACTLILWLFDEEIF